MSISYVGSPVEEFSSGFEEEVGEGKQLLSSGKVEIVRKRFRLTALSLKRSSKSFGHPFKRLLNNKAAFLAVSVS